MLFRCQPVRVPIFFSLSFVLFLAGGWVLLSVSWRIWPDKIYFSSIMINCSDLRRYTRFTKAFKLLKFCALHLMHLCMPKMECKDFVYYTSKCKKNSAFLLLISNFINLFQCFQTFPIYKLFLILMGYFQNVLYVSDLARKNDKLLSERSKVYSW